jgi:glucokinase
MHLLGIDIGATKTDIALLTQEGKFIKSQKVLTKEIFDKTDSPSAKLSEYVLNYCQSININILNLIGIGVGIPGDVDPDTKLIGTCPNMKILDGIPLETELTEYLGIPSAVENDVNLICLGELNEGTGKGVKHLACIYVGTGIGCGLILNGKLYRGADGAAGEIGHSILVPEGRPCNCGQKGCLEMYCSGKALTYRAPIVLEGKDAGSNSYLINDLGEWSVAEAVINAAKRGNKDAIKEIGDAFYYLGVGVVNLVNTINPSMVILGGGILEGWPEGIDIVRDIARKHTRSVVKERITIERPSLGGRAGLVGAAFLLQERFT